MKHLLSIQPAGCALGVLLACLAAPAGALPPAPEGDGGFYYKIGGARPISVPPNPNVTKITLSGSASLNTVFSCGKLDFDLSLKDSFNDIKAGITTLGDQLLLAVNAAVASLPMYIIHRANPDLYDTLQQALAYSKELVSLSTKSCQQIEQEIIASKGTSNPYANLATMAVARDWTVQLGTEPSITKAEKKVNANGGKNGLVWIKGPLINGERHAGGAGQPPIEPTGDTMFSGWNILFNRPPGDTTAPVAPPAGTVPLYDYWPSPAAAKAWVQTVIGDMLMTTYDGGNNQSIPGTGLEPELYSLTQTVKSSLSGLLSGATPPTLTNLNTVSAPDIAVTRQVVDAISTLSPGEQQAVVERMSGEIAMSRIVDKALMARQVLQTGRQAPEILVCGPVQENLDATIAKLDTAIQSLIFANKVRQEIVSNTAIELLQYDANKRTRSLQRPVTIPNDPKPLKNGAVQ